MSYVSICQIIVLILYEIITVNANRYDDEINKVKE